MCGVLVCYVGSESEAQSVVKPFLDLGPVMTMVYNSSLNPQHNTTQLTQFFLTCNSYKNDL